MTEAEINQAIAEALGWKWKPKGDKWGPLVHPWIAPDGTRSPSAPNFYRDLNACAEMENWLSLVQERVYAHALRKVLGFHNHTYFDWIHATAPQRCEAFLKTIGRWKE